MNKILNHILAASSLALACGCSAPRAQTPASQEQPVTLQVDASKVIAPIQPTMYGIFFEDINFAADGGLYAEMIKNRSFEFADPLMGWEQPNSDRFSMNEGSGFATALKRQNIQPNVHFLRVDVKSEKGYQLINSGFRGMGVKKGEQYNLTLQAKLLDGNPALFFELIGEEGQVLGQTRVNPTGTEWKDYKASFAATATEMKARLRIRFEGKGVVDLDMISLFPEDTWMNRPQGLRKDLVQLLADLKPGFLRFPGGCIVEGRTLDQRYQWKKTIGDVHERELLINRWNTEFEHRPTPDYFQSFGLGFFEYFQLSEDIGAEPLPILSCGMACQFNTGELVPLDQMDPYIQDALDLIEFANGPVPSAWGSLRAKMGHPEPFGMKYIGVGNEQWGPEYIKRYRLFEEAIKARYPEMIIVSGSGPFPDGEMFEYGMQELKELNAEIIDEHYYRNPAWFLENADRYDDYDRNGPRIFAGEYAAQSVAIASPENRNNWECALAEAAFITGLERNAEVVHMTSYAPLMAHAEGWQWTPDLIWFNNLESYGTANYYVQKLFSTNRGTHVIPFTENGMELTGQDNLYATASKDVNAGELVLKLVNAADKPQNIDILLNGIVNTEGSGLLTFLSETNLKVENSFNQPQTISPEDQNIAVENGRCKLSLPAYSLSVLRIKVSFEES